MPRKELLFSLSGEVGAEVVLLDGRPPAAVISAPSREAELGSGGPSRGVNDPSLTNTQNTFERCQEWNFQMSFQLFSNFFKNYNTYNISGNNERASYIIFTTLLQCCTMPI